MRVRVPAQTTTPTTTSTGSLRRQVERLTSGLPRGWALAEPEWHRRHRGILIVLWLHVVGVPIFGVVRGETLAHSLFESTGIVVLALAAATERLPRRWRMSAASIGLLTASAVLVHLSGGSIEMHFHFFVMVPLIALYQDWFPFLLAIGYVALHHGVAGMIDPASVYNHPAALSSPWKWAGIHALFITATSTVCLTTWKMLEAALNDARSEARVKSEFLSIMSHEIRTPLTAVIGYSGLLEDSELSAEGRGHVAAIRRSGDHLLSLVNDILDYSKLEAGKLELDEEPIDMLRLIDDTLGLLSESARQHDVTLSSLCESSVPRELVGDSGRIAQILLNFVSNGIKFSDGGEVFVRAAGRMVDKGRCEVTLAVSDTGIGISEEDMERLFSPFVQAEASTSRRFGGTGLGLSIARHLCHLMGGTIEVESAPGHGSTFSASFVMDVAATGSNSYKSPPTRIRALIVCETTPEDCLILEYLTQWGISPRVVDGLEAIRRAQTGMRWDVIFVRPPVGELDAVAFTEEMRRHSAPDVPHVTLVGQLPEGREDSSFDSVFGEPLRQSRLYNLLVSLGAGDELGPPDVGSDDGTGLAEEHPLRILVAEDNHVNQKVIVARLARMGYVADTVSNGAEAIQATALRDYDVVLMDVHMPECDGLSATRQIRAGDGVHQPTIVAVTADSTDDIQAACVDAGMDAYLTKPLVPAELVEALRACKPGRTPQTAAT